jgi:hypothetical protein
MQQLMAQQAVLMAQNELIMQRLGASRIWQQSCLNFGSISKNTAAGWPC